MSATVPTTAAPPALLALAAAGRRQLADRRKREAEAARRDREEAAADRADAFRVLRACALAALPAEAAPFVDWRQAAFCWSHRSHAVDLAVPGFAPVRVYLLRAGDWGRAQTWEVAGHAACRGGRWQACPSLAAALAVAAGRLPPGTPPAGRSS